MGCSILLFSTLLKRLTDNLITTFQCKHCLNVFFSNPVYFVLCISKPYCEKGSAALSRLPQSPRPRKREGFYTQCSPVPESGPFASFSSPMRKVVLSFAFLVGDAQDRVQEWLVEDKVTSQACRLIRYQLGTSWAESGSPGHAALGSFFLGFVDRTPSTPSPPGQKWASCLPLQWCFCRKSVAAVLGQTLVSYV